MTNWTTDDDSSGVTVDGSIFDSAPGGLHFGQNNTTRYTWKSDRTGTRPYQCVPHIPEGMFGRVFVVPATVPPTNPVADFRLTEVQFNVPGGQDLIEIANLGSAAGDLRSYRIAAAGAAVTLVAADYPVPANGRVVIHTGQSDTNTATDIYLPALGALNDVSGSVALYVPSTPSFQNALTNSNLMIDFVQWGAGAQANETTAALAGFWTAGQAIQGVAAGHSIEYCADPGLNHGLNRWAEISPPNFGGNSDCTTPVLSETWGRLKILYRR